MAGSQTAAFRHWSRILQRWPVDKVRPENVSFQKLMQRRLDKYTSPQSTPKAASTETAKDTANNAVTPSQWNEQSQMDQANVLYSFLENRYAKEFPMPQSLRHPASGPTYYDDLAKELQEAPSRSWFEGVINRVKGSLRFS